MNSLNQRLKNDLRGLQIVHAFGWLRAKELGAFLWPQNASSTEAANRMIRSWHARKLVILRELPDRSGKAVVLALAGVRLLKSHGIDASTGKDIGSTSTEEGWRPPASWRHDLIATGVLAELHKRGYKAISEQSLRRVPTDSPKLPDGLLCSPEGHWIWLEVEHSKKTGKNLSELGKALAFAAAGRIKAVGGQRCTKAMFAYADTVDSRGHAINHKARVLKAISEQTRESIEVIAAHCELRGAGVEKVTLLIERVERQRVLEVLRVLNAQGWQKNEDEVMYSRYSKYIAYIWQEEDGYGFQVADEMTEHLGDIADTLTGAKTRCAQTIAELL